jgi:uncharacterized membrane protein YbhN (UPF0104 family)
VSRDCASSDANGSADAGVGRRRFAARRASVAVRLVIMTAACWSVGRGIAWSEVAGTLKHARLPLLGATVALNGLMMFVKAIRLRVLLNGRASVARCFLTNLTSSALNNVTPLRGGDVGRLWTLKLHAGVTKTFAAVITIAEHIVELLALSVLACAAAASIHNQRWAVSAGAALSVATVSAIVLVGYAGRHPPTTATDARGGVKRMWRLLRERVQPAAAILGLPRTVTAAIALSFLSCIVEARMVMLTSEAVGQPTGMALALVVLLGINVAMALPSLPASAGVFEAGAILVLMRAGVAKDRALAFAIVYHLVQVVPVTLVGGIAVLRSGLTLSRLAPATHGPAVERFKPVLAARTTEDGQ